MTRIYKEAVCTYCKETKLIAAKGLCRACYQRWRNSGKLEYQRKGIRNICNITGCDKHVVTNGLCDSHRKRLERYGQTDSLRPVDWGKKTKHPLYIYWNDTKRRETLNISLEWKNDFWSFVDTVKVRPSKDHFIRAVRLEEELGPENWQWIKGKTQAERQMANRKKSKKHERNRVIVSREERENLLVKANNKCEICGRKSDQDNPITKGKTITLCVDHCHDTSKIRGMLCKACNSGIGYLKDSTELLRKAILYLERNK